MLANTYSNGFPVKPPIVDLDWRPQVTIYANVFAILPAGGISGVGTMRSKGCSLDRRLGLP